MKKMPDWIWPVIRVSVLTLLFSLYLAYVLALDEQRHRTDGWPASSESRGSNDREMANAERRGV